MRWTDGLRLLPTILRARVRNDAPYRLLLSLTEGCNHRCQHCHSWAKERQEELSVDEVDRILGSLPSLRWLTLTGGEIMTRPDIAEIFEVVRAHAPRLIFLNFTTNGALPGKTAALAPRLAHPRGPRPVVNVSIDGPRALHDQMRGRPGAFDLAVATAKRLATEPLVDAYVGTTLTPLNIERVDEVHLSLRDALPELVPSHWHVNFMTRSAHFFDNLGVEAPSKEQVIAASYRVEALRGVPRDAFALVERLSLRNLRAYLRRARAPVPCQAVRASLYVGSQGATYGCHILERPLGELRETGEDLRRVLSSAAASGERHRIRAEACDACWTPCEAYHAMLASPFRTVLSAMAPDAW